MRLIDANDLYEKLRGWREVHAYDPGLREDEKAKDKVFRLEDNMRTVLMTPVIDAIPVQYIYQWMAKTGMHYEAIHRMVNDWRKES